jgi:hypothetical protein
MKHIFTLLLFVFVYTNTFAQDDETQYLFELHDLSVSGFGGVLLEYTTIDGSFGLLTGGGGAVILNQTFYLGGFGCGLTTDHIWPDIYPDEHSNTNPLPAKFSNMSLNLGYGGLWIGYINQSHKLVHWGINAKIGGGNVSLIDRDYYIDESDLVADDNIFVFIPTVEAEVNLAKWFKVSGGIGYRFVGSLDDKTYTNVSGNVVNYYENSDISSPTVFLSFLFGGFGKR